MTNVTRRRLGLGAVGPVAAAPGLVLAQEPVAEAEAVVSSGFIFTDAPYPEAHAAQTPGKGPRYPLVLATQPLPSGYAYPALIQTADGMDHAMIDPRRLA